MEKSVTGDCKNIVTDENMKICQILKSRITLCQVVFDQTMFIY